MRKSRATAPFVTQDKIELTSDGAAMLGFAHQILEAQAKATRHFGGEPVTGHLRFGVSEDLVSRALPKILFEFRHDYPGVDLELSIGLSEEITHSCGPTSWMWPSSSADRKDGRLIFDDRLVWAGAAGAIANLTHPIPVVTYLPPSLTRATPLSVLDQAGIPYRITCTTKGQLGLRAAAVAGLGFIVHSERLLPLDVVPVQGLPVPGPIQFTLITTACRAQSAPERALTRAIVENTHRLRRSPH
jgi:DNA-binding transcriptional LysR family regulator